MTRLTPGEAVLAATLDRLARDIHRDQINKGFYERCQRCDATGQITIPDASVGVSVLCACPDCKGSGSTTERNFGEMIALMHSELSEALEAHRLCTKHDRPVMDDKLPERQSVEVELADAVIRILDTAAHLGLSIGTAVVLKSAYNRTRPFKHGKAY